MDEVVVTAQKREESLQDTPISIVAFTPEDLEQKGITGLTDLRSLVPNVQMTPHPNGAATTMINIRGVGITDDQITQDPSVAVYLDGIYVARSQGLAMDIAELARVEVLRGPQGSLYGRNAKGGAVNFITLPPTLGEWEFKEQLSFGNRDWFRNRTAVNVPLGSSVAARLSYLNMSQDGYVRNLGTNVARFGDRDREAWRAEVG
ncbi:MAG: TonB-dependent receptor [Candidatus Sumerlaeia bacterium]|nr:TonB-dependent receptor [Candidatus Sumerlaeia bacterium]